MLPINELSCFQLLYFQSINFPRQQMGFGESIYYNLAYRFGEYAFILAGILVIVAFFFYILDIDEWNSTVGKSFCFLSMVLMFLSFVLLVMLVSNEHPSGVISLFSLLLPLWVLIVKSLFYRHKDTKTYVR